MPLDASRCAKCALTWLPVRERCARCAGRLEATTVPDEGDVLTWTVVHVPPAGFEPGALVALVALGDAVALASAEPGVAVAVGARVRVRAAGGRLILRAE